MASAGGGDIDIAAVEAWLDAAPATAVAAWCGLDAQALRRLCQRMGLRVDRSLDVRELLFRWAEWIREKQRSTKSSPDLDDNENLVERKLKEEIRSLQKRREWVDERIKQIKREYVKTADVAERIKKLTTALLRAGEQLGQRHGAEAQETFNAAIDGVLASFASKKKAKPAASRKRKKS